MARLAGARVEVLPKYTLGNDAYEILVVVKTDAFEVRQTQMLYREDITGPVLDYCLEMLVASVKDAIRKRFKRPMLLLVETEPDQAKK